MTRYDLLAPASLELSQLAEIQVCLCWPGHPKPTAGSLGLDGITTGAYQPDPPDGGVIPLPRPRLPYEPYEPYEPSRQLPAGAELIAVDTAGLPESRGWYGYFIYHAPDDEAAAEEPLQRFEVDLSADVLRQLSHRLGLDHLWDD